MDVLYRELSLCRSPGKTEGLQRVDAFCSSRRRTSERSAGKADGFSTDHALTAVLSDLVPVLLLVAVTVSVLV
ncbi:MAG: hypothetical protein ABEK01_04790 [Candidatus Nanohaloarchaea archaeon]